MTNTETVSTERLTAYEMQVLIGTTIHGCNMAPDRVFSLDIAWHRLHAIGLIDRKDGLAIATIKGREVVDAALRAASIPAPVTSEADGGFWRATRKFQLGDRVTKTKGSSWTGKVVGFYSTTMTPVGYAVESENEPGSVQIYPEAALSVKPGEQG